MNSLLFDLPAGVEFLPEASLDAFTTFRLGGPCAGLVQCQTSEQLEETVKSFIEHDLPFILIGGGSNLVVSDEGLPCYVIRFVSDQPLVRQEGYDLIVSGSTILDHLARLTLQENLDGLIFTSGIPGTVGGAVVGNAGAFGKQVGDVIKWVNVLGRDGVKRQVGLDYLQFTYRHSRLKETGDIVLDVCFALKPGDKQALLTERDNLLALRREKHPNLSTHPCAGSFFRNVEPTSKAEKRQATGWFLEQVGGKSLFHGGAKIFDKHANIIVKGDGCKAQDVYELSKKMQTLVKDHFNLDIIREVRFVGRFENMPKTDEVIW